MNNVQSLSERIIHADSAGIILLIIFASFLNQTIFAESNPAASSNSHKGMKSSSAAPPESPLTKSSCEKAPMQCSSLCQTALAAESQAAKLEKSSKEARANADKTVQKAVAIEKKTNKKLQKMGISTNASSSGSVSSQSKALKIAAIVPPVFASNEARARARKEDKESKQYGVNAPPDNSSQEAAELLMKSHVASKSAEESQRVAADAKMKAAQARADADSVRQSYKSCLSGMESQ
jgi:hypothetical protein